MRFRTDRYIFQTTLMKAGIGMECNRKLIICFIIVILVVFVNEIGSLAMGKEIQNSLDEENDPGKTLGRFEMEKLKLWIKRSAANIGGKEGNIEERAPNIRAKRKSMIRRTRRKRVSSFPWWWGCGSSGCDDDKF